MESLIAAVSVYARKYGLSRLSEESGISRSQLHRVLNGKNTSLETIGRILEVLGLSLTIKKTREDLTLSLANKEALKFALAVHGAPLLVDRERELEFKGQKIPSKNKTLIAALQKGREDSAINAVLPIFIHKNWNEIDLGELMMAEVDPRYLAYQLDLLYRLTNSLDYLDAMTNVRPKKKITSKQVLIRGRRRNKMLERIFSRIENGAAQAWGYKTSDSFDSIEARFKKWSNVAV